MAPKEKQKSNSDVLKKFTSEENSVRKKIEEEAIANFSGDLTTLASALGYLRLGYELGWRVLYIVYHKATIKKYEKILSISSKELFPEEGPGAMRSRGFKISKAIGKFWEIVRGQEKIEKKTHSSTSSTYPLMSG